MVWKKQFKNISINQWDLQKKIKKILQSEIIVISQVNIEDQLTKIVRLIDKIT